MRLLPFAVLSVIALFILGNALWFILPAKADDTNLMPIPSGFTNSTAWNLGKEYETVYHGLSYPNTIDGKDFCIGLHRTQYYVDLGMSANAELNGPWINVAPGDHVILRAWFWANDSTVGDNLEDGAGLRLALDISSNDGRICELGGLNGERTFDYNWTAVNLMAVHYGTKTWTQVEMEFTVNATYQADPWTQGGGIYELNEAAVPSKFIPLICTWTQNATYEAANGYVWGTEVYVNPSAEATPTPTATAAATSTSTATAVFQTSQGIDSIIALGCIAGVLLMVFYPMVQQFRGKR